jgi:hypothetical protein
MSIVFRWTAHRLRKTPQRQSATTAIHLLIPIAETLHRTAVQELPIPVQVQKITNPAQVGTNLQQIAVALQTVIVTTTPAHPITTEIQETTTKAVLHPAIVVSIPADHPHLPETPVPLRAEVQCVLREAEVALAVHPEVLQVVAVVAAVVDVDNSFHEKILFGCLV